MPGDMNILGILEKAKLWGEKSAFANQTSSDSEILNEIWNKVRLSWQLPWITANSQLYRYRGALPDRETNSKIVTFDVESIPCVGIDGSQIYSPQDSPISFAWVSAAGYKVGEGVLTELNAS